MAATIHELTFRNRIFDPSVAFVKSWVFLSSGMVSCIPWIGRSIKEDGLGKKHEAPLIPPFWASSETR